MKIFGRQWSKAGGSRLLAVDGTVDTLSRWLRLDIRYYAKSAVQLTAGQAAVFVVALATSMVFVRLASPKAYGQFNYVISVLGLLSIFSLPGMSTAITRAVARGRDKVFVDAIKARLRWSLLGSPVAGAVGLYYVWFGGATNLGVSFLIGAAVFPLFVTGDTYHAFLHGRRRFGQLAVYEAIAALLPSVALVAALLIFPGRLLPVLVAYLVSRSAVTYALLATTLTAPRSQEADASALAFGRHMSVQGVIDIVAQNYDKVMVALFVSFADLGIYSVALSVMLLERVVYVPLRPMFVGLAQLEESVARREVRRRLPLAVVVFGLVCALAGAAAYVLIPLVYTEKYQSSVPYAELLILSVFLEAPGQVIAQFFKSQQKVAALYKLNLVAGVLQIGLATVLVVPFGVLGMALSRIAYQGGRSAVAWFLLRQGGP